MERVEVGNLLILPAAPYFPCKDSSDTTAWLNDKEWRLFDALWQCEGTMVTRNYLWVYLYPNPRKRPLIRAVDVIASRVRKRLAFLFHGENCIRQIRNEGYKFCIPEYC